MIFGTPRQHDTRYTWIVTFMVTTFAWMVNTGIFVTERLIVGKPGGYGQILVNEITGSYSVLLLMPGLLWGFRRFPLTRNRWVVPFGFQTLSVVIFGFCHTTLMTLTRKAIYAGIGWESYDPGNLGFRYLMEFQKQFLIFWFIYGVYVLFKYVRKTQEERLRASQLEKQLFRTRLQVLKEQLNPHFLFNTLNMISSTMYEDVDRADRMLVHLSDFLRLTLAGNNSQTMTMAHEMDLLTHYLKIMEARFGEHLEVEVNAEEDTERALFPSLVLQTLVENSIKHGMGKTGHRLNIQVRSNRVGEQLSVRVRDNGPGLSQKNGM
ncbi:MAG: histidine kinase, partial [Desulfobacterales bacterium]|nr:histidine kinase [Desulfobacterales bacterium]